MARQGLCSVGRLPIARALGQLGSVTLHLGEHEPGGRVRESQVAVFEKEVPAR
jgi:hypothetical protein